MFGSDSFVLPEFLPIFFEHGLEPLVDDLLDKLRKRTPITWISSRLIRDSVANWNSFLLAHWSSLSGSAASSSTITSRLSAVNRSSETSAYRSSRACSSACSIRCQRLQPDWMSLRAKFSVKFPFEPMTPPSPYSRFVVTYSPLL